MKPLNNKVILKEWQEEKTESGILIPDKKPGEGVFEVVNPGEQPDLKAGDKVLIDEFAGKGRMISGEKLYFVDYSDVIAIL